MTKKLRPRDVTNTATPSIIPMQTTHTDRCLTLWRKRFGVVEEHAEEWLANGCRTSDKPTQGFVAINDNDIIGFGIAAVTPRDYAQDYLNPADVDVWERTGVLHILAVEGRSENQGVGSQLVAARLQWLATQTDAQGVVGLAWHRDNHKDSRVLFEKYGFDAIETVSEYYNQIEGETPCPDCEPAGECYCDATAYRRSLADYRSPEQ